MTFNLDGEPLSGKTSVWAVTGGPALPAAARLPAAALIRLLKQRRCPAGIQQPGSLIEPLNVKVKRHLRMQEKPGQDIDPNNALTLTDDTTTTKTYNIK